MQIILLLTDSQGQDSYHKSITFTLYSTFVPTVFVTVDTEPTVSTCCMRLWMVVEVTVAFTMLLLQQLSLCVRTQSSERASEQVAKLEHVNAHSFQLPPTNQLGLYIASRPPLRTANSWLCRLSQSLSVIFLQVQQLGPLNVLLNLWL